MCGKGGVSMDMGVGVGGRNVGGCGRIGGVWWLRWLQKIKDSATQAALFIFFIVYTAVGALVFEALEHPAEVGAQYEAGASLNDSRLEFLRALDEATSTPLDTGLVERALVKYEIAVENAVNSGVSPLPPYYSYQWSYVESVFFASTVITTIGYGNMAPVTLWGRVFCITYGLVGIPVTLSVIAALGSSFANIVSALYSRVGKRIFKRLKCIDVNSGTNGKSRGLMVFGAILSLLLYISIGGWLFTLWEDWTFFESFYFCFITMTTIGLGDLVPANTDLMLVCTVYILIGLALTSTIIELVRRQYAESWQQVKELSGRLGELSGPLAEQLRRLGEQAGDLNIDVHLMKDLKDLKSALQLSNKLETLSMLDPKLKNDNLLEILKSQLNGGDGEGEADPLQPLSTLTSQQQGGGRRKVIQVVIYETSV